MKTIHGTEWDLLEALWACGPSTAKDVTAHVRARRQWSYSTVKTLLDRMVAKGLVEAHRVGNVWQYTAKLKAGAARRSAWKSFVEIAFGGAIAPALRFVASDAKLTAEQRSTLRKLLVEEGDR